MTAALAILLCAWGHLYRDGFPATWSTQLARLVGGIFCLGGSLALRPDWTGAALGAAVYVGFYLDQEHARGQGAAKPSDALWLAWSGVTSLAALAAVAWWLISPWCALAPLVGLVKPPIWFGMWFIRPDRWWAWAQPTRVAAIIFGALVGAALVFMK